MTAIKSQIDPFGAALSSCPAEDARILISGSGTVRASSLMSSCNQVGQLCLVGCYPWAASSSCPLSRAMARMRKTGHKTRGLSEARTLMPIPFRWSALVWFRKRPSETQLVVAAFGRPTSSRHLRGDRRRWRDRGGRDRSSGCAHGQCFHRLAFACVRSRLEEFPAAFTYGSRERRGRPRISRLPPL